MDPLLVRAPMAEQVCSISTRTRARTRSSSSSTTTTTVWEKMQEKGP